MNNAQRSLALLISFLPWGEVHTVQVHWGLFSQIHGNPEGQSICVLLEEKSTLAMPQAEPFCPLPAPSPCPRMPHIQVVDEGLVGTLIHLAGLSELDHVQTLGFPELRELAPSS